MVKKKDKKKVSKKNNKFLEKIKTGLLKIRDILNNPKPIIIALGIICLLLIYAFANYTSKYKTYVGQIATEDVKVKLVQITLNPKVNTALATTASYTGEDKDVYQYDIGYYYESNGKLVAFSGITSSSSKKLKLSELIETGSYVNIIEMANQETNFTKSFKKNVSKLHLIIKASTTEATDDDYDIKYDIPVEIVNFNS